MNSAHPLCFICSAVIDVELAVYVIVSQFGECNETDKELSISVRLSIHVLVCLSEEKKQEQHFYSIDSG